MRLLECPLIFLWHWYPNLLLVFKKFRKHNDILFIDASQHFEKVKTQNVLRPEDIDKVIDTYKNREFEDKYAYVPMDEIKRMIIISIFLDTLIHLKMRNLLI